MKESYLNRTIGLLGEEAYQTLSKKTVVVFGLGGVGGTALEGLFRLGVKRLVIVDFDKVDETNLNRQILYSENDIGNSKVDVAMSHLKNIDSSVEIIPLSIKANEETVSLIKEYNADFVIDAIDDIKGKIAITKYCLENNIPFIISTGMANRLDPSKVYLTKLDKTYNDPLAKTLRHEFKELHLPINKIMCVASSEEPHKFNGKLNSIMTVPSSAGLLMTYYFISYFIK